MKKFWLFLIFPIACVLMGFSLAWVLNIHVLTGWEALGMPPGGAADILDADASYVYVTTSGGEVYRWLVRWEQALPLDQPLSEGKRICESLTPRLPAPPGKVIERIEGTECYADGMAYYHYVLIDDGSLWRWGFTTSPLMLALYPLLGIAGCLVGLTLAGFIVGLAKVLSSKRRGVA